MLVHKLSLIILMLLLCHHGVDAKRTVICEGGSAHLGCDLGFIKVIKANFGRTDRTTCISGRPSNQISNVHCFRQSSLHTVSARCDGRKSCSVPAVNSVFSDPCFGTYKFLDITYDCIPSKRSITCENTQSVIVCDSGVILVHYANYGRRDLSICPHKLAKTPNCFSPQTSSLRSRCNGKKSCSLSASNSLYSDPCPGVNKYLEVTYSLRLLPHFKHITMLLQKIHWISLIILLCRQGIEMKRYFTCEGGSVQLGCDWGYIKVVTANYGRTDRTTCSSGRSARELSNVHCFHETSVQMMANRCDGRKSCSVPAADSVFSDPCAGTYKYLDVSYLCLPVRRSVTCEGSQGLIDCGNAVIWIHHANYGRRDLVTCPHKLATSSDCYCPQTSSLRSSCNGKKTCHLNASNSVFTNQCPDVHKYLEVTYSCV
ncbi:L-rhamnose-binding lectin CSL1 [Danio aesculapii]|uniref:L-rhamnose-binding lectin CSL1 n=1 Tax=Danio aesculapii TaxID=1142201 RepID=UPI0024C00071|nr:L-rhamnose-binding lectin CSL1 [Danio aesculapii]